MSEFAKRVIRMRGIFPIAKEDLLDAPDVLASKVIRVGAEPEVNKIGYPRASSLYSACMRKHVLGTKFEKEEKQWGGVKTRLIFGFGKAVHFWLQNTGDLFGDDRIGWWKCQSCGVIMYFGKPPKARCKNCGASPKAAVYVEHSMRLKRPYFVTGHPDLFVSRDNGICVLEIKTLNGEEFVKLAGPIVEHEMQVVTYVWGLSKDKSLPIKINDQVGYILYISKKHLAKELPLKMFAVKITVPLVERMKKKLLEYREGVRNFPDMLPEPASVCKRGDFENYAAKTCVCLKECLKYGKV